MVSSNTGGNMNGWVMKVKAVLRLLHDDPRNALRASSEFENMPPVGCQHSSLATWLCTAPCPVSASAVEVPSSNLATVGPLHPPGAPATLPAVDVAPSPRHPKISRRAEDPDDSTSMALELIRAPARQLTTPPCRPQSSTPPLEPVQAPAEADSVQAPAPTLQPLDPSVPDTTDAEHPQPFIFLQEQSASDNHTTSFNQTHCQLDALDTPTTACGTSSSTNSTSPSVLPSNLQLQRLDKAQLVHQASKVMPDRQTGASTKRAALDKRGLAKHCTLPPTRPRSTLRLGTTGTSGASCCGGAGLIELMNSGSGLSADCWRAPDLDLQQIHPGSRAGSCTSSRLSSLCKLEEALHFRHCDSDSLQRPSPPKVTGGGQHRVSGFEAIATIVQVYTGGSSKPLGDALDYMRQHKASQRQPQSRQLGDRQQAPAEARAKGMPSAAITSGRSALRSAESLPIAGVMSDLLSVLLAGNSAHTSHT